MSQIGVVRVGTLRALAVARVGVVGPTRAKHGERVATWVEVLTGLELDEVGSARVLDSATWFRRRETLKQLGGPPVAVSQR